MKFDCNALLLFAVIDSLGQNGDQHNNQSAEDDNISDQVLERMKELCYVPSQQWWQHGMAYRTLQRGFCDVQLSVAVADKVQGTGAA